MIIEVYHADVPTFRTDEPCTFPKGFALVASMEIDTLHGTVSEQSATALHIAFERTNHIDTAWHKPEFQGRQVKVHVELPRSTSVGDVVVIDGLASLCMPVGWINVPKARPAAETAAWLEWLSRPIPTPNGDL